jgi:hypothetical protein
MRSNRIITIEKPNGCYWLWDGVLKGFERNSRAEKDRRYLQELAKAFGVTKADTGFASLTEAGVSIGIEAHRNPMRWMSLELLGHIKVAVKHPFFFEFYA